MKLNFLIVLLSLFLFISSTSLLSSNVIALTPSFSVSASPGFRVQSTSNPLVVCCARIVGDPTQVMVLWTNFSVVPFGSNTITAVGQSSPTCVTYSSTTLNATAGGTYNFSCYAAANGSYDAGSAVDNYLYFLTNYPPSLTVSASPGFNFSYGTPSTISCARIAGDPNQILTMYRNGSIVATGTSSPQSETTTLGAGTYNYTCGASEFGSYRSAFSRDNYVIVAKRTPSIAISSSPTLTLCENNVTTVVSCARINGNLSSNLTLYRNGAIVSQGTSSPQYQQATDLDVSQIYNYTCTIDSSDGWDSRATTSIIGNVGANVTFPANVVIYHSIAQTGEGVTGIYDGIPTIQATNTTNWINITGTTASNAANGLNGWQLYDSSSISQGQGASYYQTVSTEDGWNFVNEKVPGGGGINQRVNLTKTFTVPATYSLYLNASPLANVRYAIFVNGVNITPFWFTASANSYVIWNFTGQNICPGNVITPQNITSGSFQEKFGNLVVSSQGAVLIIITFVSAIMAKIFNEELSLYVTSALIFISGLLAFFPLWIGLTGAIFGAIIGIIIGRKDD